ncbi:hypothetical protein ACHAXT_001635 [Thalassiosira profunda]
MATATGASPSRKRQKPAEREEGGGTLPARDPELALIDLSEEILIDVSQYLAPPSAAMFAVALTAPSTSWQVNGPNRHGPYEFDRRRRPSDISERIITAYRMRNGEWDVLDFADVYEESEANTPANSEPRSTEQRKIGLSERISDSDLSAILLCIDAPNKLKSLKLAGLVSVNQGMGIGTPQGLDRSGTN